MKSKFKKHKNKRLSLSVVQYCILFFAFIALLLMIFPKLDIGFSALFYQFPLDFIYKTNPISVMIFRLVPIITAVFGGFCFVYLLYFTYKKNALSSPAFFLLMALIVGPGFVNYGAKECFGRARPRHILEFSGDKAFTPAAIISTQCSEDCSFPSEHASMGYYFSSFSYIVPAQYKVITFLSGAILGSVIGISRVIQGGHFLSDVIYAGLITFLSNHLCFLFWQSVWKPNRRKRKFIS